MKRKRLNAILAIVLSPSAVGSPPETCEQSSLLVNLGSVQSPNKRLGATPVVLRFDPKARYVRFVLEASQLPDCLDWSVEVRGGPQERLRQVLSHVNFANGGNKTTTLRIPDAEARFYLNECTRGGAPIVTVTRATVMDGDKNPYYSYQKVLARNPRPLFGNTGYESIPHRRLGDLVAFLAFVWFDFQWGCTGVMIAEDLLLTNWHCGGPKGVANGMWQEEIWRSALVDLSWDDDAESREARISKVELHDEKLDFAILRLSGIDTSSGPLRPATLSRRVTADAVTILHHPRAEPKRISHCEVTNFFWRNWKDVSMLTDFQHNCGTDNGSSGAPVFDGHGSVIGLHHLGFEFDATTCKAKDDVSKAIRMDFIIDHIKDKRLDLFSRLVIVE